MNRLLSCRIKIIRNAFIFWISFLSEVEHSSVETPPPELIRNPGFCVLGPLLEQDRSKLCDQPSFELAPPGTALLSMDYAAKL